MVFFMPKLITCLWSAMLSAPGATFIEHVGLGGLDLRQVRGELGRAERIGVAPSRVPPAFLSVSCSTMLHCLPHA